MKPIYRCRVCRELVEESVHCGVYAELFLDPTRRIRLSKLLSGILRHYPWEIGVNISKDGWVSIDDLVQGIKTRWRNKEMYQWVSKDHIIAIAKLDPKDRFEIKGNLIRARYGHSIDVKIDYEIYYPQILFHGTSTDRLKNILRDGLKPMKRRFVHTTTNIENALETGKRHGRPVILKINVSCLKKHGIPVYRATKDIYLIPYVPRECISI